MRYLVIAMMVIFFLCGLGMIRVAIGQAWLVFTRRRVLVRTIGIMLRVERKVSMTGGWHRQSGRQCSHLSDGQL